MPGPVFLFDVDNTLLDNDRFAAELEAALDRICGAAVRRRYWEIFETLRDQLGYADYLGTLQTLRQEHPDDVRMLGLSAVLLEHEFAPLLYPDALAAVAHVGEFGQTVVLSDGDAVFQPHKIRRSGIWDAVEGRVLIYIHKERALESMERHFAASHYVMVDDKARLLAAMKGVLGRRLTTVFVRQGHYAREAGVEQIEPRPDLAIERIGDLLSRGAADFPAAHPEGPA